MTTVRIPIGDGLFALVDAADADRWDRLLSGAEDAWLSAACALADAKPHQRSLARARLDAAHARFEAIRIRRLRVERELMGERWLRAVEVTDGSL